ncbi:hypothetical protein F4861DRAFT_545643 [Xylaria intraflava]|nr:hypothetical protein F4861DRAFT_545643 [Xylaria intraflava]
MDAPAFPDLLAASPTPAMADRRPSSDRSPTPNWIGPGSSFPDFDFNAGFHFEVPRTPNISDVYAEVHRLIDQLSTIAQSQANFAPDRIKEENSKVFERLSSLEHVVAGASSHTSRILQTGWNIPDTTMTDQMPLGNWLDSSNLDAITTPSVFGSPRDSPTKNAAVDSQPAAMLATPPSSEPTSKRSSPFRRGSMIKQRKLVPRTRTTEKNSTQMTQVPPDLMFRLHRSQKLMSKFLQIGSPEMIAEAERFSGQLRDLPFPVSCHSMPEAYGFPTMSHVLHDGSAFLRMLPRLAIAIESNIFGEQSHRIKKRIAMAHFYHAYNLAQENPRTFLAWYDEHHASAKSMLPNGSPKSIVQHRFVDLMFPRDPKKSEGPQWRKSKISKIQMWRKGGKHWAKLIMRFERGILLLIPSSVTDEELVTPSTPTTAMIDMLTCLLSPSLRVLHDDEMSALLDLLELRKPFFAEALKKANDAFLLPRPSSDENGRLTPESGSFGAAGWDELLQYTHTAR